MLLDKPVGGLPSNDGRGHHPIYINGDRLVTFAKMVGGIQDQAVLDLLRTAAGFRQLVHSVGVSITAADPAMTVDFTLGFEGERGSAGSRQGMSIPADGVERVMPLQTPAGAQGTPTPVNSCLKCPMRTMWVSATVKLYVQDGYYRPPKWTPTRLSG